MKPEIVSLIFNLASTINNKIQFSASSEVAMLSHLVLVVLAAVHSIQSCMEDADCEAGWTCTYCTLRLNPVCQCTPPAPTMPVVPPGLAPLPPGPGPILPCHLNTECPGEMTCWSVPGTPSGAPGLCGSSQPCHSHADCKRGQECKIGFSTMKLYVCNM